MCSLRAIVHASTTSRSPCVGLSTAWSISDASSRTVGRLIYTSSMRGAAYARPVPGSIRVARILGIDLRIHISWLLIFFIVTLSLADQVFPFSYLQWSQQKTFIVAAITALLFFTSVVLHELAHAL